MPQISVEQAIDDIRDGKMLIIVDDEDRENEGDLVMAAEKVTPEAVIMTFVFFLHAFIHNFFVS